MAKRLGGWWRLWIVLTVLWGCLAVTRVRNAWPQSTDPGLPNYFPASVERWTAIPRDSLKVGDIIGPPPQFTASGVRKQAALDGLEFWAIPTFVILLLGLTARWIWRGFRSKQAIN